MKLENKIILIVDDEPENLQAIADNLAVDERNYEIIKAPNGEIALKILERKIPDLIITDWEMPKMNGLELIKHLKSQDKTVDIPIIMCTGVMTSSESLNTALEAGAVDYIRKPVDKIELQARVHSMMVLSATYKQISIQKEQLAQGKKKVEELLIDSQLAFLRNQVSPHFLMNTLNNIHALIDVNTEEAQNSIIILSKLMRHLLYESERKENPITMEMDFVRNYVDLMHLRFEGKVDINLNIEESLPNKSVPPLLFTSLLENAFKHGIGIGDSSFIHIKIHSSNSQLIFEIKNAIPNNVKSDAPSGIGIQNTKKRLKLLYDNKHEFFISDNKTEFLARLTVPL